MDQTVKPTPAPINASVTLPFVLLKNEVGSVCAGAAWSFFAALGAARSSWWLAGERRVSFDPALAAAVPSAAHGAAAAPSANATHRVTAAARLINRLTWYLLIAWDEASSLEGKRAGGSNRSAQRAAHPPMCLSCSDKLSCRQDALAFFRDQFHFSRRTNPIRGIVRKKLRVLPMVGVLLLGAAAGAGLYRWWPHQVVVGGTEFGTLPRGVERNGLNLVVITLDTTRADRLGAYGRSNAGTPNFDALAQQGALFDHASTAAPITLPAHSTLFTG